MPTGERGGFDALDDLIRMSPGETAKDVIDEAIAEIVEHILANPTRFDDMYYCINKPRHGYQTKPTFEQFLLREWGPYELAEHELQGLKQRYDSIDFENLDDKLIGMGIFHIGDDVRAHITQRLRVIPSTLHKTYRARRYGATTSIVW